jgi:Rrf2 family protein
MISQTAEYALRAAVHLAGRTDTRPATAKEIADAVDVPVNYLHKILRMLRRHGLLTARRGSNGGFGLAKPPDSISVLDVLTAAEFELPRIKRCPLGLPCHPDLCPLHRLLDTQMKRIEQVFAATSLRDLMSEGPEWVGLGGSI